MQVLKADTEVKVRIGPFVDVGDGFTPQIDIALACDEAELLKHNGVATVSIAGNTWAAITDCRGWYDLTLTTTDTNTEGLLTVVVQDDSDCLPVFAHFMVVNANVYDSLYGTAAADYLQTDLLQMGGVAQSATDLKDFADAGYDPATDKVTGVKLVDTTTTNTDMKGTNNAALASSWSAALATALGNYSAARAGYLDNINNANLATIVDISTLTATVIGYISELAAANLPTDIAALPTLAEMIAGIADGSNDLQEMMRIIFAVCAGKTNGGGTTTINVRDSGDAKNRVVATVDSSGNRTAVTLDGS